MKKLPVYLSMALGLALITNMYSCSADGDYEEYWLNKEFKTRSAPEVYYIESQGQVHYTFGNKRLKVNATLLWESGEAGYPWPNLSVIACDTTRLDTTVCDFDYIFRWTGSSSFPQILVDIFYNYWQTTDSIQPDGTYLRKKKDDSFQMYLDPPEGTVVTGPGPEIHLGIITDSCTTE